MKIQEEENAKDFGSDSFDGILLLSPFHYYHYYVVYDDDIFCRVCATSSSSSSFETETNDGVLPIWNAISDTMRMSVMIVINFVIPLTHR